MYLVLKVENYPPSKEFWSSKDASRRSNWIDLYETIINWFCLSNSFRRNNFVDIYLNDTLIHIDGDRIRYLAPSSRSITSLIDKAINKFDMLSNDSIIESTPGITISKISLEDKIDEYSSPWYRLNFNRFPKNIVYSKHGTLFNFDMDEAKLIDVPALSLSQAIIWLQFSSDW